MKNVNNALRKLFNVAARLDALYLVEYLANHKSSNDLIAMMDLLPVFDFL